MATKGSHYSGVVGRANWGSSLPSAPEDGEQFIDNMNNIHYIYDSTAGGWWGAAMTTSTSTSTTSTSSSTSSSTTTSTSSSTSTTSTSSSTTTSI